MEMIERGRWRAGKKLDVFLGEVEISLAKWKKLPSGTLRLYPDEVNRIANTLQMSDFERQKLMRLAGCADQLEDRIPVARIEWAFRCLLDNPEVDGPNTKALMHLCPSFLPQFAVRSTRQTVRNTSDDLDVSGDLVGSCDVSHH